MLFPTEPSNDDLIATLKTLAAAAKVQADASLAQVASSKKHWKMPECKQPVFDAGNHRCEPLAYQNFKDRFLMFTRDCETDEEKLYFLRSSVKNDAFNLIKGLKVSDDNFAVAVSILDEQYNRKSDIREKLLTGLVQFKFPPVNQDMSNFVSSMINFRVHLAELASGHNLNVLQQDEEDMGQNLCRCVIHNALPGYILDQYQTLVHKTYPSLYDFLTKCQEVADRVNRKNKNKINNSGKTTPILQTGAAATNNDIVSTIPQSVNALGAHAPRSNGGYRAPVRLCIYCDGSHASVRCPNFTSVATCFSL